MSNPLFSISYGLYILTARQDGFDNGCIINTFAQISDKPRLVSISVNKNNKTHDMIKQTGLFNVSVLTEKTDFAVFEHFGFKSGRNEPKFFSPDSLSRSKNGLVYIPSFTSAWFSLSVVDEYETDSHTVFIAEIIESAVISDDRPLTYAYYHEHIKPKPKEDGKKGYRCKICGYVYEGDSLPEDFICPLCKHPASDFEKIV